MLSQWNSKVKPWLQVNLSEKNAKKASLVVKAVAGVRSNLASAVSSGNLGKQEMEFFNNCWAGWLKKWEEQGYQITPGKWHLTAPVGQAIYICSMRATKEKRTLVVPGVKKNGKTLLKPISVIVIPGNSPLPPSHPDKDLPPHWRAILGELELLQAQISLQRTAVCGMEAIQRSALVPCRKYRKELKKEIKRRNDALRAAIANKTSGYQFATDYWRVEECFWSLCHDDDRPHGCSIFDSLRQRLQQWRRPVCKANKMTIRDFTPGKETVAAINREISGMVLKRSAGAPAGTVLRQLRPAITVREKNTNRVLAGRVVSS